MPELPEVQLQAELAASVLGGCPLQAAELLDPRLCADPWPALAGQALQGARRRGKHLLLDLPGATLVLHLRMSGQLVPAGTTRAPRLRLRTAQGGLELTDPRRFATLRVAPPGGEARVLPPLGDEPWPERQPGAWWATRLASARQPLKVALMDQQRVAGLGNIAAAEVCARAALSPHRAPASLDAADWDRLADAAWSFLDAVLREERARGLRYLSAGGLAPEAFLVYSRGGAPCWRCGAPLVREAQRGRSTTWCPACQR